MLVYGIENIELPYAALHHGDTVEVLPGAVRHTSHRLAYPQRAGKTDQGRASRRQIPEWAISEKDSIQVSYDKTLLLQPIRSSF